MHSKSRNLVALAIYYLHRYPNPDEQIERLMKLPALKGKRYKDYKHIFIPCNAGGHWILLNVQLESEIVEIYDSFNTRCNAEVKLVEKFFINTQILRYPSKLNRHLIPCPQQQHGTLDCGIFVLENLRNLLYEGADNKGHFRYDMHCIPDIRLRIIRELRRRKLEKNYQYVVDPNYPPPPANP